MIDLRHALGFYLVWAVLSEGHHLVAGIAAALAAAALAARLRGGRSARILILPALAYTPGFLWRAVAGGIDVARRVFDPRMPIAPAFLRHRFTTGDEAVQVLFCDVVSLMPGSLGAGIERNAAVFHLLADTPSTRRQLAEEERRIARLVAADGAAG